MSAAPDTARMHIFIFNNGNLTESISGGDKHVIDIAREWLKAHRVTFMIPDFAAKTTPDGVEIVTYRAWMPKSLLSLLVAYGLRFIHAVRVGPKIPADVVISSPGLFDLVPAILHKRRHGSKVAVYAYHVTPSRKARTLTRWLQFRIARAAQVFAFRYYKQADIVLTCNNYVKEELVREGIAPEMISVRYLSVNVAAVRAAQPIPKYQALFVGRLVAAKGVFDLVEAIKDLPVTVGLVGEGEEKEKLRRLIYTYGMEDRVDLVGFLAPSDPRLYGFLKGCDFFLFPSYEEGYGIVIAEAIVAGKPVIAYELPHYKEAFNDSLLTVPRGDVAALREKVRDFIEGRIDVPSIREKYKGVRILDEAEAAALDLREIMGDRPRAAPCNSR